jgi:hypothetical protein
MWRSFPSPRQGGYEGFSRCRFSFLDPFLPLFFAPFFSRFLSFFLSFLAFFSSRRFCLAAPLASSLAVSCSCSCARASASASGGGGTAPVPGTVSWYVLPAAGGSPGRSSS